MLLVQGARDRTEEAWQRAAWITAHLLQPWISEPITPQQLLEPRGADMDNLLDPAAAFDALLERQRERAWPR